MSRRDKCGVLMDVLPFIQMQHAAAARGSLFRGSGCAGWLASWRRQRIYPRPRPLCDPGVVADVTWLSEAQGAIAVRPKLEAQLRAAVGALVDAAPGESH